MKKIFAVVLALAMVAGLCVGCSSSSTTTTTAAPETTAAVETTTAAPETTVAETTAAASLANVTDYTNMDNWLKFAEGEGTADLFVVCPTVSSGDDGSINMSLDNEEDKADFADEAAGFFNVFGQDATLYAPYYQQGTLAALLFMGSEEVEAAALDTAYQDIRAAFEYYLANCDSSRPLILAGHSQGSCMILRLMKEYFNDEALQNRLVAAYTLGWALTEEEVQEYPWLVPATGESDTGVIVLYNTEAEGTTSSITVAEGEKSYCINPLNWVTDETPADASMNHGSELEDGVIVPALTGAYINTERGTLIATDCDPDEWNVPIFPYGVFHAFDLPWFSVNLQENTAVRLAAWSAK